MITIHIHEEVGLDSNFATKKVTSGLTGRLMILMRDGDACYNNVVEQNGDLDDLMNVLSQGVGELGKLWAQRILDEEGSTRCPEKLEARPTRPDEGRSTPG